MAITTWINKAGGNFNTGANWNNGVAGPNDTALITAPGTYTVTSSQNNSVGTLQMAKEATLDIQDPNTLDVTAGTGAGKGALAGTINVEDGAALDLGTDGADTTFNNTGAINLQTTGDLTRLEVSGSVTLTGKGKINFSSIEGNIIQGHGGAAATLTNGGASSGNTISGDVDIDDSNLSFINGAKGIVDANIYINTDQNDITNNGLMEAAAGATLALGSDLSQAAKGQIKATTSGSTIFLNNITITGGVVSTAKGSALRAEDGPCEINTTEAIKSAGEIVTNGANLTIDGAVTNTNTGMLSANGNNTLVVGGAVTGGAADIADAGVVEFGGPSSAKVSFQAGSTGGLLLGDATKFTGTVTGMSADPDAGIVLANIPFADGPVVSPLSASGVLTVTDPVTHVVDKIKIVGGGSFMASHGLFGETLITDPPSNSASVQPDSAHLLAQSIASFGASGSVTGSAHGGVADTHGSSDFLTAAHHG